MIAIETGILVHAHPPEMPGHNKAKDPHELFVAARRDLRDVLGAGRGQLAEAKLAVGVAHPDPVRRERVKVNVEPQRAVAALHNRDRAYLSLAHRAQPELSLRTSTKALLQRADEGPQHVRAQLAVVAQH